MPNLIYIYLSIALCFIPELLKIPILKITVSNEFKAYQNAKFINMKLQCNAFSV